MKRSETCPPNEIGPFFTDMIAPLKSRTRVFPTIALLYLALIKEFFQQLFKLASETVGNPICKLFDI